MESGIDEDPLLGFNFMLELEGRATGYFTECSGIGSENEVVEHKIVDESGREIVRKIPGRMKWTDITLKRGITKAMDIWEWRDLVVTGKMAEARTNATITMLSRDYEQQVAVWNLTNAWPSKVSGPSLKSDGNDIGVEELVIVHEGMSRDPV
jgi:phage tail-like protein